MVYIKGSAFANFIRNGFHKHFFAGSSQYVSSGAPCFGSNVVGTGAPLKVQIASQSYTTGSSQSFFSSQGTQNTAYTGHAFSAPSNPLIPVYTVEDQKRERDSKLPCINHANFTTALPGQVSSFSRGYSTQTSVGNIANPVSQITPETLTDIPSETAVEIGAFTETDDLLIEKFREWREKKSFELIVEEYNLLQGKRPNIPKAVYDYAIEAFCSIRKLRYSEKAIKLGLSVLEDMESNGIVPDGDSYGPLIAAYCDRDKGLQTAVETLEYSSDVNSKHFESRKQYLQQHLSNEGIRSAIQLFNKAVSKGVKFPLFVYNSLLRAASKLCSINEMLMVYSVLEKSDLKANARTFQILIMAFGDAGDINTALMVYNDYKNRIRNLPAHDESWIYDALIYAYFACKDPAGAIKFFKKVHDSNPSAIKLDTLIRVCLGLSENDDHEGAYLWLSRIIAEERLANPSLVVMSSLLANAVNDGNLEMAHKMFDLTPHISVINSPGQGFSLYSRACLKQGDIKRAKQVIEFCTMTTKYHAGDVVSDVVLELAKSDPEEAIELLIKTCLSAFKRSGALSSVRTLYAKLGADLLDQLRSQNHINGERFARIVDSLRWFRKVVTEDNAIATAWALTCLVEQNDFPIRLFSSRQTVDMILLDFEMLHNVGKLRDFAAAFEASILAITSHGVPIIQVYRNFITEFVTWRNSPKLTQSWENFISPQSNQATSHRPCTTILQQIPENARSMRVRVKESLVFDPDVNHRFLFSPDAASLINAFLEWKAAVKHNCNIHPVTYFKLMERLAKINRFDYVQEVYEHAKKGIPQVTHPDSCPLVWAYVENALIISAAYEGDYTKARIHHDNLLKTGFAPNANAFAACVLNVKEATKDEATAALDYFNEALSLGVCPTVYLYNVVMAKLAKARRINDVLALLESMRLNGLPPNPITFGTLINVCCRTDNETMAKQFFDEMEAMEPYKYRVAPYNIMMQYYVHTRRNREMVLYYFSKMATHKCKPSSHTFRLVIEAYCALEPIDFAAAERVMQDMVSNYQIQPDSQHYAVILHAKGCILKDYEGAMSYFKSLVNSGVKLDETLYQAVLEVCIANRHFDEVDKLLQSMQHRNVTMTAYIANILIHGWTVQGDIVKAREIYEKLKHAKEPSTYEAMARAYIAFGDHNSAEAILEEMTARQFPPAVMSTVSDLLTGAETSKLL